MIVRRLTFLAFALSIGLLVGAKPTHKLTSVKKSPQEISKQIAAALNPAGYGIVGPQGPICEVWLVKSLAVKSSFTPDLNIQYPFTSGQLIGVLRVAQKAEFTDFRGQEVGGGVYTLRYGQQPPDGNHIGTSDLYDFLLAIPAKFDADPKPLNGIEALHMKSAKTAGSTHPAVFSLLPTTKAAKAASLTHDDDLEFWILTLSGSGKSKDKTVEIQVRLVAIGQSEG